MNKVFFMTIFCVISLSTGAENNNLPVDSTEILMNMDLNDLLNIPIKVATTKETSVLETPSTVSVIDQQTLRNYHFSSLADALQIVAGVQITRTTARQQIPMVRGILQDHYPNKVLVMINGVSQWNPVTGETGSLNRVSINEIDHIEILKGPASVLYGTNAFSGAINVVLKNNQNKTSGNLSATAGTANYFRGESYANIATNGKSIFFSVNGQNEKGDRIALVDAKRNSGNFNDFIDYSNLTFGFDTKHHSFLFNAYKELQQKLGVDAEYAAALGQPQDMYGYLINYNNQFSINKKSEFRSNMTFDWQQRLMPRSLGLSQQYTDLAGWRGTAGAKWLYSFLECLQTEVGVDVDYRNSVRYRNFVVLKDSTVSDNYMTGRTIYEGSGYAQASYKIALTSIVFGDRITYNQHYGFNNSLRGTLVQSINKNNSIKFIYGQSYRAPSMFEVYYSAPNKKLGGNPDLKPETSNSFELAYLTSFNNFFIQLLGSYAQYNNKIFRVTKADPFKLPDGNMSLANSKTYVNGHKFYSITPELELRYQSKYFTSFVSFCYQRGSHGDTVGTGDTTHYNLKYIPSFTGAGGLSFNKNGFFASTYTVGNSSVKGGLVTNGLSETLLPQFKINMSVGYTHIVNMFTLTHTVSVINLLNKELEVADYVDRTLSSIPIDTKRRIGYTLDIQF